MTRPAIRTMCLARRLICGYQSSCGALYQNNTCWVGLGACIMAAVTLVPQIIRVFALASRALP